MKQLLIAFVIWNCITFLLMGADKLQAKRRGSRISEKILLTAAFAMGALGVSAGTAAFHHKTLKTTFQVPLVAAARINIIIVALVIYKLVIQ